MSLTSREYQQAIVAGETARRAGHKKTTNPHRHDSTRDGQLRAGAWDAGWDQADSGKGRARRR